MSPALVHVGDGRVEARVIAAAASSSNTRTTLVFLHEGLGSIGLWRDFPDRVASRTGLRAIVYSRRGYGRSDPVALPRPITFMHDEARGDLPKLLDALDASDVILIGHSDGASISLIYGSADHAHLRGVVVMAPHVFVEDISVASIAKAREAYEAPAASSLRARLEKHHGANVDIAFRGWNDVWLDPAFRSWNIEDAVSRITAPLLVIQGKDDEYGTLAQVESIRSHAKTRCETLVLDDCGHSPHRDQPALTLDAIAHFVTSLLTTTATGTQDS